MTSPTPSNELVGRLRATKTQTKVRSIYGGALAYSDGETREVPVNPDGPEAAETILRLEAEIAELREAVEGLIGWGSHDEGCATMWPNFDPDKKCDCGLTKAERRARASLSGEQSDG